MCPLKGAFNMYLNITQPSKRMKSCRLQRRGARMYYAKRHKSIRERQKKDFTHTWSLRKKTNEENDKKEKEANQNTDT